MVFVEIYIGPTKIGAYLSSNVWISTITVTITFSHFSLGSHMKTPESLGLLCFPMKKRGNFKKT